MNVLIATSIFNYALEEGILEDHIRWVKYPSGEFTIMYDLSNTEETFKTKLFPESDIVTSELPMDGLPENSSESINLYYSNRTIEEQVACESVFEWLTFIGWKGEVNITPISSINDLFSLDDLTISDEWGGWLPMFAFNIPNLTVVNNQGSRFKYLNGTLDTSVNFQPLKIIDVLTDDIRNTNVIIYDNQ